jgi:hypothetical protein
MSMTNYTESGVLNHLFRTGTFSKPSTISVGLTTDIPADNVTGGDANEVANAGSYARVDVGAPVDGDWDFVDQGPGASGHTQNTAAITFPAASANWGMVSGIIICDNATYAAGNVLMTGKLNSPRDIQNGDTFSFGIGDVDIYLS